MDTQRAIGIVRVSQPKGRSGPSFSSPEDQRDKIKGLCAEKGWDLIECHDELHVSGNALLEDRPGLSRAVTAVITGRADVIVGAHSERLWWSHEVRAQVLRIVEEAGGEVWAVDAGRLTSATAAEAFSGEVRTSADRFSRRQNAEKSRTAVERAVRRGVVPFPDVPPGLTKDADGMLRADPETIGVATEAFTRRAGGATIREVRAFLRERGIERSYHGVQSMLTSRLYLGEIHFGSLVNLQAHETLIDRDLWEAAQAAYVSRGRRPKSARLLARLGVLRCGTCHGRMVVGTAGHDGTYPMYRCSPTGDCQRRVTISAVVAEREITEVVRALLANVEGQASAEGRARDAQLVAEKAQADLEAAIRAFGGIEDEPVAIDKIAKLRAKRDEARSIAHELGGLASAHALNLGRDWDDLTFAERRDAIAGTLRAAYVAPGRGANRLTFEPFIEDTARG